jgi:hypothetical protein
VAEADELALDAPVAPARILPGQLLDERVDFIWDSRASRGVRVGPFPREKARKGRSRSVAGFRPGIYRPSVRLTAAGLEQPLAQACDGLLELSRPEHAEGPGRAASRPAY